MLTTNDIALSDREILDVEEKILFAQKKKFVWMAEAIMNMPNSIGTRWVNAHQADDAQGILEAENEAIISYAKETGLYDEFITAEKSRIIEEHEERIHRRASNE